MTGVNSMICNNYIPSN